MRCAVSLVALALCSYPVAGCRSPKPAPQGSETATAAGGLSQADQLLLAAAKVALPPAGMAAGDLPDP